MSSLGVSVAHRSHTIYITSITPSPASVPDIPLISPSHWAARCPDLWRSRTLLGRQMTTQRRSSKPTERYIGAALSLCSVHWLWNITSCVARAHLPYPPRPPCSACWNAHISDYLYTLLHAWYSRYYLRWSEWHHLSINVACHLSTTVIRDFKLLHIGLHSKYIWTVAYVIMNAIEYTNFGHSSLLRFFSIKM